MSQLSFPAASSLRHPHSQNVAQTWIHEALQLQIEVRPVSDVALLFLVMVLAQNEVQTHTDQDQSQDQDLQDATEPVQDQSLQDPGHHQEDEEEDVETALGGMEEDAGGVRAIAVIAATMIEAGAVAVGEEGAVDVKA